MNFGADLGPWRPATGEVLPKLGNYVKPPSPSRLRRKERRAAERERCAPIGTAAANAVTVSFAAGKPAAEVASAEKADAAAEAIATGKAAEDIAATEKVAGEVLTAEKADDELMAAENAATEVAAVEKAAGEESDAVVVKAAAEVASTSSCGKEQMAARTCWNCDDGMTVDHQCEVPSPPSSTGDAVATQMSRSLKIKKFCVKCEVRHPAGQKCQCQSAEEPRRVKCCVCKVLGRENTVLVGSRCQSCGVTAS